jgi:predicted nucleic acid-binding protein
LKKAYLDANILLAKAAGSTKEPKQYQLADRFFQEIKRGDYHAVISSLRLMEVLAVLRTQKGREMKNLTGLTPEKQIEFVISESKSMYDSILFELLQLEHIAFDLGGKSDMRKIFDTAFDIMQEKQGLVKIHNNCKKCGSINMPHSAYKGLGSDDIIHALFAKDIGCDIFITFDSDFEQLKGDQRIDPLEILVIR